MERGSQPDRHRTGINWIDATGSNQQREKVVCPEGGKKCSQEPHCVPDGYAGPTDTADPPGEVLCNEYYWSTTEPGDTGECPPGAPEVCDINELVTCYNLRIENVTIENTYLAGINVTSTAAEPEVEANWDRGWQKVDPEDPYQYSVAVVGNTLNHNCSGGCEHTMQAAGSGCEGTCCQYGECVPVGCPSYGECLQVHEAHGFLISENTIMDCGKESLSLGTFSSDGEVSYNTITGPENAAGFDFAIGWGAGILFATSWGPARDIDIFNNHISEFDISYPCGLQNHSACGGSRYNTSIHLYQGDGPDANCFDIENVRIYNNSITYGGIGIQLFNDPDIVGDPEAQCGMYNIDIQHNTVVDMMWAGISLDADSLRSAIVRNNIVWDVDEHEGDSRHTSLSDCAETGIGSIYVDYNNQPGYGFVIDPRDPARPCTRLASDPLPGNRFDVESDPLLSGDLLHLSPASPVIGQGLSGWVEFDYDGFPRLRVDMGADEWMILE